MESFKSHLWRHQTDRLGSQSSGSYFILLMRSFLQAVLNKVPILTLDFRGTVVQSKLAKEVLLPISLFTHPFQSTDLYRGDENDYKCTLMATSSFGQVSFLPQSVFICQILIFPSFSETGFFMSICFPVVITKSGNIFNALSSTRCPVMQRQHFQKADAISHGTIMVTRNSSIF